MAATPKPMPGIAQQVPKPGTVGPQPGTAHQMPSQTGGGKAPKK